MKRSKPGGRVKIRNKCRKHSMQKLPYLLVVGDKEMESQTVTVRACNGDDLGPMQISQFIERLTADTLRRCRVNEEK